MKIGFYCINMEGEKVEVGLKNKVPVYMFSFS